MPPRSHALPQAATASARAARKTFFCDLCQKGYARMNDFESHEGSYDHQHRKRLKEMKQLTRDPNAVARARAAEQQRDPGFRPLSISLNNASSNSGSAGKKKPVFKPAITISHNSASSSLSSNANAGGERGGAAKGKVVDVAALDDSNDPSGAVKNGWYAERYQPRFVTSCEDERCGVCAGGSIDLGVCEGDIVMGNA